MVTHKDKEHIHNHLVVNSVSFENGLKYNASNKSLWDIKRESNRLCERENLKTLDLDHKAEKRISSAEKRIMDRGQIPWKDELRQIIDIARERTKDLQSFREFLEKNFEIETRVTKNSISYKHPDHGKAIRGRSLGDKYNKEELENEFNGQEKSIFRNGANERGRAKGNSASDMKEFQTLIKNLNAEQTVLNNRLIKTIDLIEKERELYKSNEKIREEKNKELSEKTQEAFKMMTKKSEELKELHQEKLEKALKEVENIKKYHMEMMRVLSQTVAQVERIDKLNWKDRVKQYAIQMGITLGAILIILGAYQLINLIK